MSLCNKKYILPENYFSENSLWWNQHWDLWWQRFPYYANLFLTFLFCFWFYLFIFGFGYTVQLAGSWFPDQGLNPGPWQWKSQILATGPPGNSLNFVLTKFHTYRNAGIYTCSVILPLFRGMLSLCRCSVTKSCPTLWDPMDCRTPGFPVLHYLWEFAQIHVQWVSDAI